MRIIHTSDWHLGKKYQKLSLVPEQKLFLDWLFQQIMEQQIHLLLIAGDIFDTPIPTTEALQLYFHFLDRVQRQSTCHVVVLSGNHDSGKFLSAPSPLFERVHIIGQLQANNTVHIQAQDISLAIMGLPFFRMHEIEQWRRQSLPAANAGADSREDILSAPQLLLQSITHMCRQFVQATSHATHRLMLAHHQFGHYQSAGSELTLSLSGLDSIPLVTIPEDIDVLCLGHIHRPQLLQAKGPLALYSGAPYPLRAGEPLQKNIVLLQLDANNEQRVQHQWIDVPRWRRFDRLVIELDNWREELDAYLHAQARPAGALPAIVEIALRCQHIDYQQIDSIYRYLQDKPLYLAHMRPLHVGAQEASQEAVTDVHQHTLSGLFEEFYRHQKFGQELPKNLQETFATLAHEAQLKAQQDSAAVTLDEEQADHGEDSHAPH